ncbi:sensor histidine kinase [Paenibacillus sp. WQ 127069]|uniref:histidine kinase n=1 Tax=Paenibacillus baimaensis TaxID=2982185 RepID=A0ABT2UID0_9BACL|nr:sensor histidine kinase [Paenibacillus sp. WQ 127069]MCU6794380.1 sensor histidine kinase [Paenibacillus sp. WQ 127069]
MKAVTPLLKGLSSVLPSSFKGRLYIMLFVCSFVPLLLIGGLSVYSISSILNNKIDKGLLNHLNQVMINLQKTLDYLDYSSQQFTTNGLIGKDLNQILLTDDLTETMPLHNEMKKNINLLNFTNPTIGLTMFYDKKSKQVLFSNLLTSDLDLERLPTLTRTNGAVYYGPHKTHYKYNDENMVFSISRKFDISGGNPLTSEVIIYTETNFKIFQQILNTTQYGMSAFHLLLDEDGKILYSDNNDLFLAGSMYKEKEQDRFRVFSDTNSHGWTLVLYIDRQAYNMELVRWLVAFFVVIMISVSISIFMAVKILNYVYNPLLNIKKGMVLVASNKMDSELSRSGLDEFDYIIEQFNSMNYKIKELILRVEQQEIRKRETEVAKLMAQINPHFLYNTLNTVQWLARMKGETEIDRFVALFTNVLNYNLTKEGLIVSIREEVEVLKNYIELQKIRYDYLFDVRLTVDEQTWGDRVPRFLLQPIVENSLYHGLRDEGGIIEVTVRRTEDHQLLILVRDNGYGMSEDKIKQLLSGENRSQTGMGIGLSYVDMTIQSNYGSKGRMEIESVQGSGTTVQIIIPLTGEGIHHD